MKYRPIFITATNTDIGKTYTILKLTEQFDAIFPISLEGCEED